MTLLSLIAVIALLIVGIAYANKIIGNGSPARGEYHDDENGVDAAGDAKTIEGKQAVR